MAFVLYVLAFIMLVMGGPALVAPKKFKKVMDDILDSSTTIRLLSLWTMFLAFFFLAMYPLLKGGRLMLISILGRLMLIKAVVLLWFPAVARWKSKFFYGSKTMVMILGIFCIIFAAFLVWAGLAKF